MGWRRRHRTRPIRCSIAAYRRAHDRGPQALASYLSTCGRPSKALLPAKKRARMPSGVGKDRR